ncbi:MAG: class I SAM-dependent methyltransferase [Desulfovibrio sp.]
MVLNEREEYVLQAEKLLLESMAAPWNRRGHKLVDLGCGTGNFLELLWNTGFDVTGVDRSLEKIEQARTRFAKRVVDLHVHSIDALPFADREFDYSVLWNVLEFISNPEEVLREAARVSAKGMLIGFYNSHSVYNMTSVVHSKAKKYPFKLLKSFNIDKPRDIRSSHCLSYPQVRKMVQAATGRKVTRARSVLPGPPCCWKSSKFWNKVNTVLYPPHLGVFTAVRVDFVKTKPLTPIVLWRPGFEK